MNTELVKLTVLFLGVVLFVTACRRHNDSADDKMQKQLSGTWFFEAKYAQGSDSEQQTIAVAPDGSYSLTISIPGATNGHIRSVSMEGRFRVEGGFLVDTCTKHSQNLSVPSTNRSRIVRMDGRELVLEYEKLPGAVYPTNPIVFLKQIK